MILPETKKYLYPGAILCGGKSKRMGGNPKAGLVCDDGLTLIEHVYCALMKVCSRIILVGHCNGLPESLNHLEKIEDIHQGLGPIGALEALLTSDIDDEYLIAPCDLVNASEDLFLLLTKDSIDAPVILGEMQDKVYYHPTIGRYSKKNLPIIQDHIQRNELALYQLIQSMDADVVLVPKHLQKALVNVNSIENF